ncbi:FAD-dependent oxidoreductase [Schinkia sp. CFF1]
MPQYPEPYWRDGIELPKFNQLNEDIETDVVIVGGGITGITAAYLLVKEGIKVALIDAGKLLNGTTGHTTAKITAQHDLIYDEFINHFGISKARMYYEANSNALKFIKNTIHELQIDCDFSEQDAYLYTTSEQNVQKIEKEYQAYQKLNIDGKLVREIPFTIKTYLALGMKNQAQFHPLKYLTRLVKEITDKGGLIFEDTTAVNIESEDRKATVLTRDGKRIIGNGVLCCSHFPFYESTGFYFTRLYADRSYVLATKTKMDYPGGMYLSVDQPSRSIRFTPVDGETLLIIGGESHKAGQGKDTSEHYKALEKFAKESFNLNQFDYRWSTQDLTTLDKMPYVGEITKSQPNILIATGYRKWGMTNGTAAAMLLRDIALNQENPYKDIYTPTRFYADPSLKKFFTENADVAKHLLKGKLELADKSLDDLKNDEGAVVMINGTRKGAYRDSEGKLHIVDTTCTHVGCECNWNDGDRTWDCPCHGSRFSYTGEVIEGPAEKPLQHENFTMLENLTSEKSGY